jgi:glyoxylase-like metal-dependent hydrolase (beta-lactamase superfamily II)
MGKGLQEMIFVQMLIGDMNNFTYLIGDENSGLAVVIDPAGGVSRIIREAKKHHLKIAYIINTHTHFDHIRGNEELALRTGAKIIMYGRSRATKDLSVKDGDAVEVGSLKIRVIHTPGHTPESVCLLIGKSLLTGDTLFVGGCGRTDLEGGSSEDLYNSLSRLMRLDNGVRIYPGHNYGNRVYSTIGYEKRHNYALKSIKNKDEFVRSIES